MLLQVNFESSYDTEADTLYIYLQPKGTKAAGTMQISDTMMADVDGIGNLVGIEILFYSQRFEAAKKKKKK